MTDLGRSFTRYTPLLADFVAHEVVVGMAVLCMVVIERGVEAAGASATVQWMFCMHGFFALLRLLLAMEEAATEPPGARICTNPCCKPKQARAVRRQRRGRRRGRGR